VPKTRSQYASSTGASFTPAAVSRARTNPGFVTPCGVPYALITVFAGGRLVVVVTAAAKESYSVVSSQPFASLSKVLNTTSAN
jgi:hypothetical protein